MQVDWYGWDSATILLPVKKLLLAAGNAHKNCLFCSKFCLDTIILLEFCSAPENISSPSSRKFR